MTIVRRAGPDDAGVISALNADVQALHAAAMPWLFKPASPEAFPPAKVLELIAVPVNAFFVAEVDGAGAGYVYASIHRQPESYYGYGYRFLHVNQISVRPACRRRDVERALLDATAAFARVEGIDRLGLDTWTFNAEARAFFERYGLETYNERRWMRL